jgi:putative transposase
MEKYDTLEGFGKSLEEIAREGARQMLHQAIENEVTEFVEQFKNIRTLNGRLIVKRNGYFYLKEKCKQE